MSNIQRELIGSVELDKTRSGKPVVNLYSTDTRLAFPVLRLFDLSALLTVGIDPETLGTERVYQRFYAYYVESDKTNAQGHPYRDVQQLEPMDKPATSTSADTSALLAELRAMNAILENICGILELTAIHQGLDLPQLERDADEILGPRSPLYGNGSPVSDNPAERESFAAYKALEGQPPESVDALRQWFRSQNGN